MKKRLRNKRIKQKCIKYSSSINNFIKQQLINKSPIFRETALFMIFGRNCLERNRFKKNQYIDYKLSQLVYIEIIFNTKILKTKINDN